MKRVAESSGANYSVHKEGSKPQARVTPVGSVYKKTEIPNIAAMQRESMTKENAPTPVGTNYKPVQTTPRKMEQRWNTATTSGDAGANAVRAEREKFEKEVRDREIEKSRQVSHTPPPAAPPATPSRPQVDFERRDREEREKREQQQREDEQRQQDEQRQREQDEQKQREQEQENYRRQQEEEDRRQQEEEDNYRRQQQEEDNHRRQQDEQRQREEEDRHRQQQEEQRRKEDEQRKQQEEQRRQEEEERKHRQQQEEDHRRQQEAEEEEERQREEAARLQNELNQTADRAVHAAGTAAASATASSDASQGVSAVVLFAYDASESNEMTLFEGEVVHQIDQVDEGWWFGVSEDGKKQGLFPANYVQILEPEQHQEQDIPPPPPAPPAPAPPQAPQAPPQAPQAPPAPTPPQAPQVEEQGNVAVALYDYQAEEDNEISFVEGDVITQIDFVSEDWWQGVSANGKSNGLFPANYVELKK